jgi:hypothetical protein
MGRKASRIEGDNNVCYSGVGVNYQKLGCMIAWMNERGENAGIRVSTS